MNRAVAVLRVYHDRVTTSSRLPGQKCTERSLPVASRVLFKFSGHLRTVREPSDLVTVTVAISEE